MSEGRTPSWQFLCHAARTRYGMTSLTALMIVGGLWILLADQATSPVRGENQAKATSPDLAVVEAQNGDWSRWRGPLGDGVSQETNLLPAWPADGPPLAWKSKGLGKGYASVSVAHGKIYTMGDVKGKSHLICLDAAQGDVDWSVPFGKGHPNCTPTVDGDLIFALSRDGVIACVDSKGQKKWSKDFVGDMDGKVPQWGYSESPLIDGEHLICTPGSSKHFVVALNKLTGELIWSTPAGKLSKNRGHGGAGYSSVVISNACDVKQYVTLTGSGVVGVNATDGKLLWDYDHVANKTACIPTPLVKDHFIFCSSGYGDGGTALLELTKSDTGFQAKEVYYFAAKQLQNHHGGMIRLGDAVFMGHGHNNGFPVCVNLANGKDNWRQGRGPGGESAAIAYADGHLYFRYQDGVMALIEANPKEYKVTGEFKLPIINEKSWPHPVIAGGKLYLRDQNDLMVFDIQKH